MSAEISPQPDFARGSDVRLQLLFHLAERLTIIGGRFRSYAIGGDLDLKIAHVGIVCGVKDADVSSEAGEDKPPGSKVL